MPAARSRTLVNRGDVPFCEITIHPDRSLVGQWGMNWQWGKV
jgi:hypothetical protein